LSCIFFSSVSWSICWRACMRLAFSRWYILLGLSVVLSVSGCGGADKAYPVRGTVVYEDETPAKELAGGMVTFTDSEPGRGSAIGGIRDDGTYRLSFRAKEDGALPGEYRVSISPAQQEEVGDAPRRAAAKATFTDFQTVTQNVTVQAR